MGVRRRWEVVLRSEGLLQEFSVFFILVPEFEDTVALFLALVKFHVFNKLFDM